MKHSTLLNVTPYPFEGLVYGSIPWSTHPQYKIAHWYRVPLALIGIFRLSIVQCGIS